MKINVKIQLQACMQVNSQWSKVEQVIKMIKTANSHFKFRAASTNLKGWILMMYQKRK
jgi:hypothetical protein